MKSFTIRCGIHCGLNYIVKTMQDNDTVKGVTINYTQRVMSLGDANHILVSGQYYQTVLDHNIDYKSKCYMVGSYRVKNDLVEIYNVFDQDIYGNPDRPEFADNIEDKFKLTQERSKDVYMLKEIIDTPIKEYQSTKLNLGLEEESQQYIKPYPSAKSWFLRRFSKLIDYQCTINHNITIEEIHKLKKLIFDNVASEFKSLFKYSNPPLQFDELDNYLNFASEDFVYY